MKLCLVDLHLRYRRFRYLLSFKKTRGDVATADSIKNQAVLRTRQYCEPGSIANQAVLRTRQYCEPGSIDNYIGEKKYVSFSPSAMCESTLNLGGERSRLWMLRQGKRAEEAGMIS